MQDNTVREIRQATLNDVEQIAEIKVESYPTNNKQPQGIKTSLQAFFRNEFKKRWLIQWESGFNILILTENNHTIGLLSYSKLAPKNIKTQESAEIHNIYVLEEWRGKGLGKLLCQAALAKLREEQYREIVVWIFEDSHPIRRFYEGLGFCATTDLRLDKIRKSLFLKEIQYKLTLI